MYFSASTGREAGDRDVDGVYHRVS
jgi:hypothetical protein